MKESPISDAEFEAFLEANEIGPGTSGYKYVQDYVQKKYQEGELKGRIAENEESVYLIQSVKSIDQFDRNFISLKLADRKDELESQLERKEQ